MSGATARATRPGIVVPPPRRSARLATAVAFARMIAGARRRVDGIVPVLFRCFTGGPCDTIVAYPQPSQSGYRIPGVGNGVVTVAPYDGLPYRVNSRAARERFIGGSDDGP